jgi:hypothetical protein
MEEVKDIASINKYKAWERGDSSTWRNAFDADSRISLLYSYLVAYDSLLASVDTIAQNALIRNKIAALTSDAEQNPLDKSSFEQYYFQTTEAVGLYNLARLQAEVAYREYMVMKAMNEKMKRINLGDIKFDQIQPFATSESEVVEEGQPYKATVFFVAFAKGWLAVPLRMRSSEGTVEVKDGIGKVRFKATADKFDANGLAKKTWKGSIILKTYRGDTTFSVETEYFVRKK